jgi:hypothetical protein
MSALESISALPAGEGLGAAPHDLQLAEILIRLIERGAEEVHAAR